MSFRVCGDSCPAANTNDILLCDKCETVIHLKCYGLSKQNAKFLTESHNTQFYCDSCIGNQLTLAEIAKNIETVTDAVKDIKIAVSKVADKPANPFSKNVAALNVGVSIKQTTNNWICLLLSTK